MTNPTLKVDKIRLTGLFKLKSSGSRFYIVIPRPIIESYGILSQDLLKIEVKEVRRTRKGSGISEEEKFEEEVIG